MYNLLVQTNKMLCNNNYNMFQLHMYITSVNVSIAQLLMKYLAGD